MLGHDPDEELDAAVDSIRERLAPDASRSPSTVLEREAALEATSLGITNANGYPALLADVAEVLLEETRREPSDAASLFEMGIASLEIRRLCVCELVHFDVERRLETDGTLDADDRLLPALAALVREGDVLDPDVDLSRSFATFPDDAPMPTSVVDALNDLLYAATNDLVARHAATLEATRRAVLDRVLAPTGPADVARTDARIAAVLLVEPALDTPDPERENAVVDRLTTATDPLVRAWGPFVAVVGESHPDDHAIATTAVDEDLLDAIESTVSGLPTVSSERKHLVARLLCRAIVRSPASTRRRRWVRRLSDLALGLHSPYGLGAFPSTELERLVLDDALDDADRTVLFDRVHEAVTSLGFEEDVGRAAPLVETLADENLLTTPFTDRLLRALARDLESGEPPAVRNALGEITSLFDVTFDLEEPSLQAVAASASQDLLRRVFDAAADVCRHGGNEEAPAAARALRNVAVANPFHDATILETYDDLVETAATSTDRGRDRAALAIEEAAYGRVLHPEQAERFLTEQRPHDVAASVRCIDATDVLLSKYDVVEEFDVLAFAAAAFKRLPELDPNAQESIAEALETVAREHSFEDPAAGIEFLELVLDTDAHLYGSCDADLYLTWKFATIVEAVPQPQSTAAVSPLLERLRSDDPHVRRATVRLLALGTPVDDEFQPLSDDPQDSLLPDSLLGQFVHPLVAHVRRSRPDAEFPAIATSLLAQYADAGHLTDAQLDAVAALAVSLFERDEERAATLLQSDSVLDRLYSSTVDRVFEAFVSTLEPIDSDEDDGFRFGLSSVEEDPTGALGVLDALLRGEHVTLSSFVDAIGIREFGHPDAPSLTTYLTATHPATPRLLSLLKTTAALAWTSADLSPALDRALASGSLDTENRFRVLEERMTVQTTAELGSSPSERETE